MHPDRHTNHHEIFGKGHKAKRHFAVVTGTSAFQVTFVGIGGFKHADRVNVCNEQRGGS